jgi:hypothetical protein
LADGWCWFVLREEYCWLVAGGWFVLREKYCWLVADKPSEQAARAMFVWIVSHRSALLFSQNKSATSKQSAVLFSQNKSAPAVSHQPNEHAFGVAAFCAAAAYLSGTT